MLTLIVAEKQLDPVPADANVTAGWLGLLVFLALLAATVLLLVAMTRQMRRVNRNAEEGRYDEQPPADRPAGGSTAGR